MSSEVKRYNIYITESGRFERHEFAELIKDEDVDGEFVLYTDYESLRLSHEETTKQLRALEDVIAKWDILLVAESDGFNLSPIEIDAEGPYNENDWGLIQKHLENSRARKQMETNGKK